MILAFIDAVGFLMPIFRFFVGKGISVDSNLARFESIAQPEELRPLKIS